MYYLIFIKNELHVVPVGPDQEISFFQLHGQRILASGETIPEVLRNFHDVPLIIENG